MWPKDRRRKMRRSDRVGASTTRGEPPSYHGKMHTHGALQPPVLMNRRLIRPLGTTQKHPIGQWSLLLVRCAPVWCVLYTEDNSRNSPLVIPTCCVYSSTNTHDLTLDIYTNTPPQWKVHPRTHATLIYAIAYRGNALIQRGYRKTNSRTVLRTAESCVASQTVKQLGIFAVLNMARIETKSSKIT